MGLGPHPGLLAGIPRIAAKEGLLGGQGILAVHTGAEDSLLMRCSRRLAEGTLSKGSRSPRLVPLSGHRGTLTARRCTGALCPGPPRDKPASGETETRGVKAPLRHSLAFLPRGRA